MCWVMPPASPETTLAWRMASSSEVLPWSTWPMMVTTGGRGCNSSSTSGLSNRPSTTSDSATRLTVWPSSVAISSAVSASITSVILCICPCRISSLITSTPRSDMRLASSWMVMVSGRTTSRDNFSFCSTTPFMRWVRRRKAATERVRSSPSSLGGGAGDGQAAPLLFGAARRLGRGDGELGRERRAQARRERGRGRAAGGGRRAGGAAADAAAGCAVGLAGGAGGGLGAKTICCGRLPLVGANETGGSFSGCGWGCPCGAAAPPAGGGALLPRRGAWPRPRGRDGFPRRACAPRRRRARRARRRPVRRGPWPRPPGGGGPRPRGRGRR